MGISRLFYLLLVLVTWVLNSAHIFLAQLELFVIDFHSSCVPARGAFFFVIAHGVLLFLRYVGRLLLLRGSVYFGCARFVLYLILALSMNWGICIVTTT